MSASSQIQQTLLRAQSCNKTFNYAWWVPIINIMGIMGGIINTIICHWSHHMNLPYKAAYPALVVGYISFIRSVITVSKKKEQSKTNNH